MFLKFQIIIFTLLSCFLAQASSVELERKLRSAVMSSNITEIRKLIKEDGVNINASLNEYDFTALHLAASMDDYELVQELRTLGADPFARAEGGVVPYHITGNLDIIKTFVLDDKIDPNIEDDSESTIVHYPYMNSVETLQFLKEAGLDLKKKNKYGATALHASSTKEPEIIDYFIENGVDVHAKITEGEFKDLTALHMQSTGSGTESLLKAGAKTDVTDKNGFTPAHGMSLDPEKLRHLLAYEANPNARADDGTTPLHRAVGLPSIYTNMLLEAGAHPNPRDEEGKTPLHYIQGSGPRSFKEALNLIKAGADSTIKDNKGQLPDIVQAHPRLLLLSKGEEYGGKETSCRYTSNSSLAEPSQINAVQCGRKSICMAEVYCSVVIGMSPNREFVGRNFQAVCSSLSNGECPEAIDCVLDRSMIEKEEDSSSSNTATPQSSSSKGVH